MPAENVTIKAAWTLNTYTVTYELDGGVNAAGNPAAYTVESETIRLAVPTKLGYDFLGWTGSNGDTPEKTVEIASGSTGDKRFTAVWELCAAKVGDSYYTTVQAAIDAADGAVVQLQKTVSESCTVSGDVTIDLNGFTLGGTLTVNGGTVGLYHGTATAVTLNGKDAKLTYVEGEPSAVMGTLTTAGGAALKTALADNSGYRQGNVWSTAPEGKQLTNVTVEKLPVKAVTVTADKSAYTYGDTVTLTAAVQGAESGAEMAYQWYQDGRRLEGATGSSYSVELPNAGSYSFRCEATCDYYTVSDTASVTVARLDMSKAEVTLGAALTYNGKEQKQSIASVTVNGLPVTCTVTNDSGKAAGEYVLTLTGTGNFSGSKDVSFTIGKAAAAAAETAGITVYNGAESSGTVDLRSLLPAIPTGCTYGAITYGTPKAALHSGYEAAAMTVENGVLTLTVNGRNGKTEGDAGTVTVTVSTANYQDMELTVHITAVNKGIPEGQPTLSRSWLRYGEALGSIRLSGSMRSGNTVVRGTFRWTEPNTVPTVTEEGQRCTAEWIFTPYDSNRFATVSGTATVRVTDVPEEKHDVGGEVRYTDGTAIANASVTIRQGNKIYYTGRTDENGHFAIVGVKNGSYNLVVEVQTERNGVPMTKTVTTLLKLDKTSESGVTVEIPPIPAEPISSKLEQAPNVPDTVVGGLDDLAKKAYDEEKPGAGDGEKPTVEVKMEVRKPEGNDQQKQVERELQKEAPGKTLDVIDIGLTLVKDGKEETLPETGDSVLEIVISYDTSRDGITVVRHYGGMTETLEQLEDLGGEKTGSQFYIDEENQVIHIFTNKFSTYAIGYEQVVDPNDHARHYPASGSGANGGAANGGTDEDGQTVKSVDTGDMGVAIYAITALLSAGGVTLLKRKREE